MLAESAVDLKMIISTGLLRKLVPLVVVGLSCRDKACNVDDVKALVQSTNGVPAESPRLISTPNQPEEWVNFMANAGDNVVREFVKRTVWVKVDRALVSEQHVVDKNTCQVKVYADYAAKRHSSYEVSDAIVA